MGGREHYLLGVDGGGTSCRARLCAADGRLLGEGFAGSANVQLGVGQAYDSILKATDDALAAAGLDRRILSQTWAGLGLAGAVDETRKAAVRAYPNPFAGVAIETDAHAACLGAHNGNEGGILILGTGSCAVGYRDGCFTVVGGWGFMVSDQGSGAWLGLNALRQALLAHEGVIPESTLGLDLMSHFDHSQVAMLNWAERALPRDYAAFAPRVLEHAEAGDIMARRLVEQSAAEACGFIERLLQLGIARIALMGGLSASIVPWLPPEIRAHLCEPLGDAMDGALLLAQGCLDAGGDA